MWKFKELGLDFWDYVLILMIGGVVFVFTHFLYPPLIKWLKKREYIGYDIHKKDRPATAESGGLGLTLGLILGLLLVMIFFPTIWKESLIFIITIAIAGLIGWIDDRIQLRSIVKIALMFITGLPVFIANLWFIGFINVESPTLPFLGQLRLNIIYPLILPFIIMIMTNTVNMLEGYNGEGSGTCSVATIFLVIIAIVISSVEGLIFAIVLLGALLAFFLVNKYPAKTFPGDIGTLVIGAALGLIGIFGSLEYALVLVMLPQVFNSFYVIASVRGFKESHDIVKKDIWLDEQDLIHANSEKDAPLTLPRLIVAPKALSEPELVKRFIALSIISGAFAILGTLFFPKLGLSVPVVIILIFFAIALILGILYVFPALRGLTLIMFVLIAIAMVLLWIIDMFIVESILNWLFGGLIGVGILVVWYVVTVIYFNHICIDGKNTDQKTIDLEEK